jgi:hypothetical protein
MSYDLRGSGSWRHDSAPAKPNAYELEDASARRNSGGANYFVGAPPSPDATPVVAKKNISSELESASETTAAVAPSNVTPTERPGPPVATPPTVGKSATPKKPKKKSFLKTLSSPVKALAKKVSPRKKAPPPPEQDTSPLSEITADRGSPRVSLEAEEIKEALAGHVDAALLPSTRKVPEWLVALKDALAAKCCVGDASGERGAAQ